MPAPRDQNRETADAALRDRSAILAGRKEHP